MGTIGESQGIVLWILGLAETELLPSLGPRGRGKGEATGNWKRSKYCRAGDLEKYSNVLWRATATAPQGRDLSLLFPSSHRLVLPLAKPKRKPEGTGALSR